MAQPWDLGRFARTTLFFNSPDAVLQRLNPINQLGLSKQKLSSGGILWSASEPLLEFGPLDDVVMGGISESTFSSGVFSGTISTENNGGFAGCRSKAMTPALDLSGFGGIRLRVNGDGQRYKCIVRDSYDWNGIAWAQSFDTTAGEFVDMSLPFSEFVPTLFARKVPGVVLDTSKLNTIQLTLSKFEYDSALNPSFREGPFELRIDEIAAY